MEEWNTSTLSWKVAYHQAFFVVAVDPRQGDPFGRVDQVLVVRSYTQNAWLPEGTPITAADVDARHGVVTGGGVDAKEV
jgi:hypothetical protein